MEIYDDVENENSKGYVVLNMIRNISESIDLLLKNGMNLTVPSNASISISNKEIAIYDKENKEITYILTEEIIGVINKARRKNV